MCFVHSHFGSAPPEDQHSVGTAFFVSVPLGLPEPMERHFLYVVTAKHCIQGKHGLADEIVLRLNLKDGGTVQVKTDPSAWMLHPTADVAVACCDPKQMSSFAFRGWDAKGVATQDFRDARKVGAGDDVFITGLLVHHPGRSQIMPIARIGNIAGLPVDPVVLETGPDVVGLLEVRSIGGLSGSPVFLHLPFLRDAPPNTVLHIGPEGIQAGSGGEHRLLGVMHGFYPVGQNDPDGVSGGDEDLNTGIAVVVFVDRVLDLINRKDQVEGRDAVKREAEAMPIPATADKQPPSGEFENFDALASKLVQVPKSEIDAKRKQERS